jgi:hypothetical protein
MTLAVPRPEPQVGDRCWNAQAWPGTKAAKIANVLTSRVRTFCLKLHASRHFLVWAADEWSFEPFEHPSSGSIHASESNWKNGRLVLDARGALAEQAAMERWLELRAVPFRQDVLAGGLVWNTGLVLPPDEEAAWRLGGETYYLCATWGAPRRSDQPKRMRPVLLSIAKLVRAPSGHGGKHGRSKKKVARITKILGAMEHGLWRSFQYPFLFNSLKQPPRVGKLVEV